MALAGESDQRDIEEGWHTCSVSDQTQSPQYLPQAAGRLVESPMALASKGAQRDKEEGWAVSLQCPC
jgi:hypothetical protein